MRARLFSISVLVLVCWFWFWACGDNRQPLRTIADHVRAQGSLSSLESALKQADLLDRLDGPGPFTLFAFRNSEFDPGELPAAESNELVAYHIHQGELSIDELQGRTALSTLEGGEIHLRFGLDGLLLNDGVVVTGESITTENGVIHFVDRALLRTVLTKNAEYGGDTNLALEGYTESVITIEETGYVHDLQVNIDIRDRDVSNISIYLRRLDGGAVIALMNGGRSRLDDVRLRFADSAENDSVTDVSRAGEAGDKAFPKQAYRPFAPLEYFLGQEIQGDWQLLIFNFGEDEVEEGQQGSELISWSMRMTYGDQLPAPALVFHPRFGGPNALARGFNETVVASVRRVGGLAGGIEVQGTAGEILAEPASIPADQDEVAVGFSVPQDAELGPRKVSLAARIGAVSRIRFYDAELVQPMSSGMELLSHVPLPALGTITGSGSDLWGWTDPSTGAEIAIFGTSDGTAFVDLSDPTAPRVLGILPTESGSSTWRDIKVYKDHAFIVSEAFDHGMQVFDLTQLRDISETQVLTTTAHVDVFGNAHNIAINEETGMAYVVGSDYEGCDGGILVFDISTATVPVAISCFSGAVTNDQPGGPLYPTDVYTHDVQCVTYAGPDSDYTGREICFSSDTASVGIADFEDPASPIQIVRITYASAGYTHQGWLTEDHKYFIMNDEFDEVDLDIPTRSYVFDVSDLDNPALVSVIDNPTNAVGHNTYIVGNIAYQANYTSGLRLVDLTGISEATTPEIAYYDTHPDDDAICATENDCGITSFDGAWSSYPFFASGVIVVSDIQRGLFVLRRSGI